MIGWLNSIKRGRLSEGFKELDDWTMIMIMIDENMEEYGTNSDVLNEGIKVYS